MVSVRFERGRDDVLGPTYGPYEYVQFTYHGLRIPNRDSEIAWWDEKTGDWFCELDQTYYSDIIIF